MQTESYLETLLEIKRKVSRRINLKKCLHIIHENFQSPPKNSRDLLDWIRHSPTMYSRMETVKQNIGIHPLLWPKILVKTMHDCRLSQILAVIQKTKNYASIFPSFSVVESLEKLPYLSRTTFSRFMDPKNNMGNHFGYDENGWITLQSGGTTNKPVYTRVAKREKESITLATFSSMRYIFDLFGGAKKLWSLYLKRSTYPQSARHIGFDYYQNKAINISQTLNNIKEERPEAIMGSVYALMNQLELIEKAKDEDMMDLLLQRIKYLLFSGERLSIKQKDKIKALLPNILIISRYASSQTVYGSIGWGLHDPEKNLHILDPSVCYTEIVNSNLQPLKGREWGEVAITNLHTLQQPIIRVLLADEGRISERDGTKLLELRGRLDDIVILNTEKIHVAPLIDAAINSVHSFGKRYDLNGVGQIVKKGARKVVVCLESNISESNYLDKKQSGYVIKNIQKAVIEIAKNNNLSWKRVLDKVCFMVEILPRNSIKRVGIRNKIQMVVDES